MVISSWDEKKFKKGEMLLLENVQILQFGQTIKYSSDNISVVQDK